MAHSNILFLSKTVIHSSDMLQSSVMVRLPQMFLSGSVAHSKRMLLSTYDDSLDDYVSVSIAGFAR